MQCWDSRLVYTYFRLTGDNRLLVGGGTAITTYLKEAYNNHRIISRVIRRFKKYFPFLEDLAFIQFWPGLIDATRDLLPIIVRPPDQPHLHFVLGSVGLPWAAFSGSFAARNSACTRKTTRLIRSDIGWETDARWYRIQLAIGYRSDLHARDRHRGS